MAEYEIEPGVFYGRKEDYCIDEYIEEYIKYKEGNNEIVVSLCGGEDVEAHDYEDQSAKRCYTDVKIRKVKEAVKAPAAEKESKVSKLLNRLKRGKEEPKTEIVTKEDRRRYNDVKKEDFLKNPKQMTGEDNPYVAEFLEKACKLIVEKGRPTYKAEQQKEAENIKLKQEEEKVKTDIAINKMIADNIKDFFG